jgi:hypothetical protein
MFVFIVVAVSLGSDERMRSGGNSSNEASLVAAEQKRYLPPTIRFFETM